MILLTGATGLIGGELLPMLLASGERVRALVRDPRKLGAQRVNVQIALGDLADPYSIRNAMRGVKTVVHLAATIRDQPRGTIEELNGLATLPPAPRRRARRGGALRLLLGDRGQRVPAHPLLPAKALAEKAVRDSDLETTVFAPSIVYAPGDPWVTLMQRLAVLPVLPISGSGDARYQPICSRDVARCVATSLNGSVPEVAERDGRYELAGPETLTYDEIAKLVARAAGHDRPLVHVPLPLVRSGLKAVELLSPDSPFATWEEAELMEVPMTSERGDEDVRSLGVEPQPMAAVLGAHQLK